MAMDQLAGVVDDIVNEMNFAVVDEPRAVAGPSAQPVQVMGGSCLDASADNAVADALSYLQRFTPRPQLVGMPWHRSPMVCVALGLRPPGLFPNTMRSLPRETWCGSR